MRGDILRAGKTLICGCCGSWFETWKGYTSQDQDVGYGICQSCQGWQEERNLAEIDKIAATVREGLNEANRAKYDRLTTDKKRLLAMQALDDGLVKFTIRGA